MERNSSTKILFLGVIFSIAFAVEVRSQPATALMDADQNHAAKEKRYADAIYTFTVGELSYKVTGKGSFAVTSLKSDKSLANIRLDFPLEALIAGVQYYSFQQDLILSYIVLFPNASVRVGDKLVRDEVRQRRIARFDPRTLKTKWVGIPALSDPPGPMTVAGGSLFVTGVGLIGEVDLVSGHYLWSYDKILQSNPPKFVFFIAPRVEGNFVFFEEDTRSRPGQIIQVKCRTGEIITMDYKR